MWRDVGQRTDHEATTTDAHPASSQTPRWHALRLQLAGPAWPGLLALLLFLALLTAPTLGSLARPLQGLLALLLAATLALRLRPIAGAYAPSRHTLAVAAIAALALGLRAWGYRFGLPYFEHPDEWAVADKALAMAQTGDLNPRRFIYPNLYIYLQLGVVVLHFLWGASNGLYTTLAEIDRAAFYSWARLLTALLGMGTVLATYGVARLFYGRTVALLAALLLAVAPAHVADSHFVTTDTPASFFTMLAFLPIALLATRPPPARSGRLALATIAGLAVGLAIATKYNVALLVLPLLLALLWAEYDARHLAGKATNPASLLAASGAPLLYALVGVALGFTLGTPYWLAELPRMLDELASIYDHYKFKGHPGLESDEPWRFYVEGLVGGGIFPALCAGAGIVLAFLRHRRADLLLLAFFVPSLLQLAGLRVVFFRNAVPLLPLVCVFAAIAAVGLLNWLASRFPRLNRTWVLPLLAALLAAGPLWQSITYSARLARPTTRLLATAWVEANAPAGSRIWLEDQTLLLPADRFRVAGGRPLVEQSLAWYREQGFRYLVATVSGYSKADRALLDQLATAAPAVERFDGRGQRNGPALWVLDTGLPGPEAEPHTRLDASLAAGVVLEGYRHPGHVAAGATLPLALYWRATEPLDRDYTVFVHLLDEKGSKLAQRDVQPLEGSLPTSRWPAGQLLRDDQDLAVPATVPPGRYRLAVGMYRADSGEPLGPQIMLTEVLVEAP